MTIGGVHGGLNETHCYAMLADEKANIQSVSPSAANLVGYSPNELLAMKIHEISPQLSPEMYSHLWKAIQTHSSSFSIDALQRKKEGRAVPVKLSFKLMGVGGKEYAFVVGDTRHDQNATTNDESGKPMEIGRGHCDWTADMDIKGTYTYVSDGAATAFGYLALDMLGKPMLDSFQVDT